MVVAVEAVAQLPLEPAARVVVDIAAVAAGDKVDVQPAVAVVVEEHGSGAGALDDVAELPIAEAVLEVNAGLLGHIGEDRHRRLVGPRPAAGAGEHGQNCQNAADCCSLCHPHGPASAFGVASGSAIRRAPRSIHRMMVCFSTSVSGWHFPAGMGLAISRDAAPSHGLEVFRPADVPDERTGPSPTGMDVLPQAGSRIGRSLRRQQRLVQAIEFPSRAAAVGVAWQGPDPLPGRRRGGRERIWMRRSARSASAKSTVMRRSTGTTATSARGHSRHPGPGWEESAPGPRGSRCTPGPGDCAPRSSRSSAGRCPGRQGAGAGSACWPARSAGRIHPA